MSNKHEIVGVWRVETVGAPFPYHMFTFHEDGTMLQSNPPAGNTETSDTAGMGVWEADKDGVRARFEEFRLNFESNEVTRGVIDCTISVEGDALTGECDFNIFSVPGDEHVGGPHHAELKGQRVRLP